MIGHHWKLVTTFGHCIVCINTYHIQIPGKTQFSPDLQVHSAILYAVDIPGVQKNRNVCGLG